MSDRKTVRAEGPNDALNGIDRWIPEPGKEPPEGFKYKSPNGIWYRTKFEAGDALAGIRSRPMENWDSDPVEAK